MPELHAVTLHEAENPSVRSVRVTAERIHEPMVVASYNAGFALIVVNEQDQPIRAYRRTDR